MAVVCLAGIMPRAALAASGTWTTINGIGSNWNDSANWSGGTIADGADNTADISTLNFGAARTITNNTARTIGHLLVGDSTTPFFTWTIAGTSTLTFDVTSGRSRLSVPVSGASATISAPLLGNDGINKIGVGLLTLGNAANSFSGGIGLNHGILAVATDGALGDAANTITVTSNAQLNVTAAISMARNITINSGAILTNNGTGATLTYNGAISGAGSFTKIGAADLVLNGTNTYQGTTTVAIAASAIRGVDGVNIPTNGLVSISAGYWESSNNITRTIGTLGGQLRITGGISGFGSSGFPMEVNLGGGSLQWGTANFAPTDFVLNGSGASGSGRLTLRNNINLAGAGRSIQVYVVTNEISGIISNTASPATALTVNGSGLLWLTGTNTFTGTVGTFINMAAGGTVRSEDGVGIPASNVSIDTGVWESSSGITRALGSGANQVRFSTAAGVGGFSAYANDITVNLGGAGAQLVWGTANLHGTEQLVLNGPHADHKLTFANAIDLGGGAGGTNRIIHVYTNVAEIIGIISGTGNCRLQKSQPGTLILSATNTWTHGSAFATNLYVFGGTIQIEKEENLSANPSVLMAKCLMLDGGGLKTTASFSIDDSNRGINLGAGGGFFDVASSTTLTIANAIAGITGNLYKRGTGTLVLSNTGNTYGTTTVGTHLESGTLSISDDLQLGTAGADFFFDSNATLRVSGTMAMGSARLVDINPSVTATIDVTNSVTATIAGIIGNASGVGSLTKIGSGTLILSGVNTYDGTTTISQGVLQGGVAQFIGAGADGDIVIAAGATLDMGGFSSAPDGVITGSGTIDNTGGAATLTVGLFPASGTFDGVIQNTGSALGITKDGTGTWTLTNPTNSYSGTTTVNGGTLKLGAANVIPNGSGKGNVSLVGAGDTLDLAGYNETINGLSGAGIVTNSTGTATLVLGDNDQTASFTGVIGDGGNTLTLIKVGTGIQTFGAIQTYSGNTTISNGTLTAGIAQAFPKGAGKGDIYVESSGKLDIAGSLCAINGLWGSGIVTNSGAVDTLTIGTNDASSTFSGNIGDNGASILAITKAGTGTLTLSGNNTYTHMTSLQGGTVSIDAENRLGLNPTAADADHIEFFGGTLKTTATFDIDDANRDIEVNAPGGTFEVDPSTTLTISSANVITGSGGIRKTGTGTLVINSANAHTGTITNEAGLLRIGSATGLGTVAGGVTVLSGAAVDLNGQTVSAEPFVISGTGIGGAGVLLNDFAGLASLSGNIGLSADSTIGGSGNLTLSGIVSNAFSLTKVGAGTHTLSGTNTYTGDTIVNAGTLQIGGGSERIANASDLVVGGGTFGLQGNNETLGTVTLTSGVITGTSGTLTGSVYNVESGTISGRLGGGGGMTKTTTGSVTISSTCTYTGETAVNNGTLVVNGTLSATPVTVNAGGILKGTGLISGAVTNKSGGTYAVGASVGAMTNGTLNLESGSTNDFEFNFSANDQIYVSTASGLTLGYGAGVNLFVESTSLAWTNNGTYFLINYSGTLNGNVTNLTVLNPQGGKDYQFTTDGSWVKLDINSAGGLPEVDNTGGATNVTAHGATLQGEVVATGGSNPDVYVYWGLTDGQTTNTNWAHTNSLGALGAGGFEVTPANWLTASTVYYYRVYGTNVNGEDWAEYTTNFTTTAESGSTEAAIDASISDATDEFGPNPNTVFTSDTVGYVFFTAPGGNVSYRKTLDGGVTWGGAVSLGDDQDDGSISVWYDKWTPGGTGNLIHITHVGATGDDLMYNSLNTSSDTAGAWRLVVNGTTWSASTRSDAPPMITRTTDGRLFAGFGATGINGAATATNPVCWSFDGTTWTTNSPTVTIDDSDFGQLLPLSGGDILLVQHDDTAPGFRSAVLSSNGTWGAFVTIATSQDDTTYLSHFGASLNKLNNNVYLVGHTDPGTAGGDLNAYKFSDSSRTWSVLAQVVDDVMTNVTAATMMVDENSGNLYAVYGEQLGAGIALNPTNVYIKVKKSTDDGASWGSATTISVGTAKDIRNVRGTLTGNERLYAVWTDDDLDDLFGNTVADLSSIGLVIGDVTVTEGNAGTTNAIFSVYMPSANLDQVTVNYATAAGTAVAGNDYTTTSGMLTFNPGTTNQTVTVVVSGDTDYELNDTFTVTLSAATNAPILRGTGTGTISNDDAFAGHYFVDKDATGGDNTGFSWVNAYTNLGSALTALGVGVEIWVAEGTYKPGTTSNDYFLVTNSVTLYGGFAGNEASLAQRPNPQVSTNRTILSGDVNGSGTANLGDALQVVQIRGTNSVIDGFTVMHGYNPDTATPGAGGLRIWWERNTVRNCVFRENAAKFGGAIAVAPAGSNQSDGQTIANCEFINNRACNEAAGDAEGSALYLSGVTAVSNCTFYGNNNTNSGAFTVGTRRGASTFVNCIFWDEEHVDGSGGADRVFYGGGVATKTTWGSGAANFCDVKSTWDTGGGANNLAIDPAFVNAGSSNLHLQANSPCIDAGTTAANASDIEGVSRPQRLGIDIGAYEADWTGKPIVANAGVGAFSATAAIVNGSLTSTGGAPTSVQVYWGTTDGELTAASWQYTNSFSGTQPVGALATNLTVPGTGVYYFRYFATNSYGGDWARPESQAFIVSGTHGVGDNMDFEDTSDNLETDPYWNNQGGDSGAYATQSVDGAFSPQSGTYMQRVTGTDGSFNDLVQYNIDLSPFTNAFVSGASFSLTPHFNNIAASGDTRIDNIFVVFRDINDTAVGTFGSGVVTVDANPATWETANVSGIVPTGAVTADLTLKWEDVDGGGYAGSYWDNVDLDITVLSGAGYQVTVAPSPLGLALVVDGSTISSNTYLWESGSIHTIAVATAVQELSDGVRYAWSDWSNGGAQTQAVTITMATNLIANFGGPEFRWRWSANVPGAGTATPATDTWYASNSVFTAEATTLNASYAFTNWSGDVSGITSNISVTMDGKKTAVANFKYAGASPLYVDDTATGTGVGTSWANALTNLQSALSAVPSGVDIWVAAGTYKPGGSASARFGSVAGVSLYGGFAGTETAVSQRDILANNAYLSGDLSGNDTTGYGGRSDNSLNVIIVSNAVTIDGFVITGGGYTNSVGAGMHLTNANATVRNCTFVNNLAGYHLYGGAMAISGGSPLIEDCTFSDNKLYDDGGGACIDIYFASPTINRCRFIGGHTYSDAGNGGAIYMDGTAGSWHATVTNCLFAGNVADFAGAIRIAGTTSSSNITNRMDLMNCTLANNRAQGTAGPAAGFEGSIWSRRFYAIMNMSNCITYANSALTGINEITNQNGGALTLNYSTIAGANGFGGTGNITNDPAFVGGPSGTWASLGTFDATTRQTVLTSSGSPGWTVNAYTGLSVNPDTSQYQQYVIVANSASTLTVWGDANAVAAAGNTYQIYNYALQTNSPAKNAGITSGAPTNDIAGTLRPQGPGTEMGAFENVQYQLTMNVVGGGYSVPTNGATYWDVNQVVTLTATANSGYEFSAWTGDVTGSVNPTNVTMSVNRAVTATFVTTTSSTSTSSSTSSTSTSTSTSTSSTTTSSTSSTTTTANGNMTVIRFK